MGSQSLRREGDSSALPAPQSAAKGSPAARGRPQRLLGDLKETPTKEERKAFRDSEREALIQRLDSEGAFDLSERLKKCGEAIPLTCTNCGEASEGEAFCRARYCPSCRPLVTAERVARWRSAVDRMRWPLFITLTIPNSEDPEQLRRLQKAWSAFRRRKLIREKVLGGVATYEITNCGNGWHPHLHAIADCRWLSLYVKEPHHRDSPETFKQKCELAKQELSTLWAEQIKEPLGIVQAKRLPEGAPRFYTLKYAAKASDLIESPQPIAPMLRVLKKTRTLAGWGNCHPLPSPDEEQEPAVGCSCCGEISTRIPTEVLKFLCTSATPRDNRTTRPHDAPQLL